MLDVAEACQNTQPPETQKTDSLTLPTFWRRTGSSYASSGASEDTKQIQNDDFSG